MRKGGEVFEQPSHPLQRLYEAMRAYLYEEKTATDVARDFGYAPESICVLADRIRRHGIAHLFRDIKHGRKDRPVVEPLRDSILALREQNLSITEIAERLCKSGRPVGHQTVWLVLREAGINRLSRRTVIERSMSSKIPLPVADVRRFEIKSGCLIQCRAPLLLVFAPHIAELTFDSLVQKAGYLGTSQVPASSYLRALLSLKLLFRPRKNDVMNIADDEGFGLFAGLNALPKTTALHDYSYRMGPDPHRKLLRSVVSARYQMGTYSSQSFNLDFHPIRHYGETKNSLLEKEYVPRRSQSVPAVVTAFVQECESKEMVYAHANILKREKADEALRFVRYWKRITGQQPRELVLDARATTHKGLAQLDSHGIIFVTLRERRQSEVARVLSIHSGMWERVELDIENRKWRTPLVLDERVELSDYPKKVRQVTAIDLGREEPTFLLTNDTKRGPGALLTRYARRTLIENSLGEQVHSFHLDALSSSVRIKVDLDVVLSVVASGCYRWLSRRLKGFETATAQRVWETFIDRPGTIEFTENEVVLRVRRFSHAPILLDAASSWRRTHIPWLGNRSIRVEVT